MEKNAKTRASASIPEYKKIEGDLRTQVRDGRWPAGSMIPSRRDLATEYLVSLLTIGRAIEPLIADGTLRSDNRRGTFVAVPPEAERRRESGGNVSGSDPESALQHPQRVDGQARDMAHGRSLTASLGTVGIVAYLAKPDDPELLIVHTLEQIFARNGDRVSVFNRSRGAGNAPIGLREMIDSAIRRDAGPIIVVCLDRDVSQTDADLSDPRLMDRAVVCILAGEVHRQIPHVFYDNRSGGYQAMQHLVDKELRNFTIVSPFTATWVTERVAGIRAAGAHAGIGKAQISNITGDGQPWQVVDDPRPITYRAVKAAVEQGWKMSGGILCVSDGVAFGVMDVAGELGLRPGDDFALIGFDDGPEARKMELSSVRPPLDAMAREAARLLYDNVRGINMSLQIRLKGDVIPRRSSQLLEMN